MKVAPWFFLVVVLASVATYTTDTDKLVLYLSVTGLILAAPLMIGFSFNFKSVLSFLVLLLAILAAISLILNVPRYSGFPVQTLLYPLIALIVCGSLWRVFIDLRGVAYGLVLAFFVLNGCVAAAASFLGVRSLPYLGEIEVGRFIFLTDFPSSSGLLWNVNYYSATQVVAFWMLFAIGKARQTTKIEWLLIYFVGLSVIMGSSRSCTAAFLVSVIAYRYFSGSKAEKFAILGCAAALLAGIGGVVAYLEQNKTLYQGLRIYRGLNSRDELWQVGWGLVQQSLWFGYGSTDVVRELMIASGAPNPTVQNSYLTYLLVYGGFYALAMSAMIALVWFRFLKCAIKTPVLNAVFALFIFTSIDALVRTYLVGGVGFIPLLMFASMVFVVRSSSGQVGAV